MTTSQLPIKFPTLFLTIILKSTTRKYVTKMWPTVLTRQTLKVGSFLHFRRTPTFLIAVKWLQVVFRMFCPLDITNFCSRLVDRLNFLWS